MERLILSASVLVIALFFLRASYSSYGLLTNRLSKARQDAAYIEKFALNLASKQNTDPITPVGSWQGSRKFVVIGRKYENQIGDICSFYLAPFDKRGISNFLPGQHLTLELPIHARHSSVMRCYSLSQSPSAQQNGSQEYYKISVKRIAASPSSQPGVGSNYLLDNLHKGDQVDVYAPAGNFTLNAKSNRPVVLIAGGVGLTPLISMLNYLLVTNSSRQIMLFYCVRNRSEHAMYDHINSVRYHCPNVNVVIFYSSPGIDDRQDIDYQINGHINIEWIKKLLKLRNYEFYICGPPTMMANILHDLKSWGVPDSDVMYEAFGSNSVEAVAPSIEIMPEKSERIFNVEFSRSGKTVQALGNSGTLLELAEANDIKARYGCRAGNCGSCQTVLKEGTVSYIRTPPREPDAGFCLPCIARAKSDLVLDI